MLAHAFFPGTGRGGDAHFDEEEEWLVADKTSKDGEYQYTTILVHLCTVVVLRYIIYTIILYVSGQYII